MDLGDALSRAFGVAVPAVAVAGGLASSLVGGHNGLFSEFITREDELEDEALDDKPAPKDVTADANEAENGASSERTPLLGANGQHQEHRKKGRSKKSVGLALIGLAEFATRLALLVRFATKTRVVPAADNIIVLIIWVYATLLPLAKPSVTPYYSLVGVYFSNLIASAVALFVALVPANEVVATGSPWRWSLVLELGHPSLCLIALAILLSMPVRETDKLPVKNAEGLNPALDDWSTLGQWMTFSWLDPLIAQGKKMPLEEADVWQLARNLRSRVILRKFELVKGASLMIRLFKANARDLLFAAIFTLSATTLQLAQPVILNKVLQAMELTVESKDLPSLNYLVLHPSVALHILAADLGFSSDGASTFEAGRGDRRSAYLWSGVAFLAMLIKAEVDLQNFFIGRRATLRAKSEAIASVYLKAMKRIDTSGAVGETAKKASAPTKGKDGKEQKTEEKKETAGSADLGKITSLVSTDANRIGFFMNFYTQMIQTPLAITLAATFLYRLMGWSAFAGYAALLIATPANHYLMKWQYRVVQVVLEMRDRRMRSMNEVIQAIKFIKLSAWETRWRERVLEHRERELRQVLLLKFAMFFINFVWDVVPILVACISLTTFTYVAGRELSVAIAFPALLTFGILTDELTSLPLVANLLQRMYASVVRIGEFLEEEEVPEWLRETPEETSALAYDERLGCENATFVWNTTAIRKEKLLADELKKKADEERRANRRSWVQMLTLRKRQPPAQQPSEADAASTTVGGATPRTPGTPEVFTLRDVSVVFPRGKLSLVYGPTGSGKSSLLSALLGEMKCLEGRIFLPKLPTKVDSKTGLRESISFCAQQPWLEHKTIRENILFGSPYDKQRYNAVLSACALVPDLKILEDGDRTEIGEKGISLSGGQKARVALARAIYAPSQTVILDDVLSAVDTHTAAVLIRRCFLGPLMQGRTLVLVTHHVESIVPHAAFIVRMANGVVEAQGSPGQLRARGDLSPSVGASGNSSKLHDEDFEPEPTDETLDVDEAKEAKKLVDKETKASGSVKVNVYLLYLKAAGYWIIGLLFLVVLLQRSMDLVQKFWIKAWSESYESHTVDAPPPKTPFHFPSASQNPLPYIAVYIGIQSFNAICSVTAQLPNMYSALFASRSLYQRMLDGVLRSPVRWFDKTPAGRILNRFAKDIDTVDTGLSYYVWSVGEQAISFLIAIGTITYGVPPFLIFAVFLGYLHCYVANGYIKTSRDLNRLESTLRSPIISAFGELLVGVATVRAFGAETRFMRLLFERLDKCQAAFYYTWMTNFWLRFRFSVLGSLTFLCTTMLALTIGIDPGLMAIVITQAQAVIGTFYWGMRAYVEAEQAFNGIERIAEYIDLPPEPPRVMDKRPPPNWPSEQGGVEFDNVVIKYAADLDPVLKNVSFTIKPREKIGLVGRTGSGKSTLAMSLFRFVDPSEGAISIDGVDITSIGVEDLRSRLTLIPQDAVLFKGTIRENLDPFNEYTDAECLDVLRAVQLPVDEPDETAVSSGESTVVASGTSTPRPDAGSKIIVTLESQVSEGGNNWSAGQRQLLAMARALLRKTRTIVLDESTASVDFETDKKIQHAIREGFKDGIMIIIAHRLHTIIECDRIMVLDAGKVVEFDNPLNLIEKDGGVFRSMCEKSDSFDALHTAAKNAASAS
ncbi:P-loop containing nucleoside triphosphate hydrolase protein [Auricularia subglabra TFB-10046 SS5]|nr:P-loop containing nucleoside triphosphate hydrolase protein [Auricularia subglabra TFB-10046 SS5]